jgi:hypothetical protein
MHVTRKRDEERKEGAWWAWESSREWHTCGRQCSHLSHLIAQSRARWYDMPFQIPCIIRIWNKGSYFFRCCHVTITLYCWQYTQSWKRADIIIIIIIIIQPLGRFWQEPEPSQATGMALACCVLGKFLGVVRNCFPLPLDIPTFAARCLHVPKTASAPSSERWNRGREWSGNFAEMTHFLYAI